MIIRSGGMYAARTIPRERNLPCGVSAREPVRATGNTVGGFRRGAQDPHAVTVQSTTEQSQHRNKSGKKGEMDG